MERGELRWKLSDTKAEEISELVQLTDCMYVLYAGGVTGEDSSKYSVRCLSLSRSVYCLYECIVINFCPAPTRPE